MKFWRFFIEIHLFIQKKKKKRLVIFCIFTSITIVFIGKYTISLFIFNMDFVQFGSWCILFRFKLTAFSFLDLYNTIYKISCNNSIILFIFMFKPRFKRELSSAIFFFLFEFSQFFFFKHSTLLIKATGLVWSRH